MIIIGITGPTGAGKTTALREIEKLGGRVIDADALYHQLLASNIPLQRELEERFGPLRDAGGAIDRKKLGGIVFRDPAALSDLNAIAHRYVGEELDRRLDQAREEGCPLAAIDAIALLESGAGERCRATVAVLAPAEDRVRRIMAREGITAEYAWSRVRAQKPDDYFVEGCGHVLVNDCAGPEEFAAKARALFLRILGEESSPCAYCADRAPQRGTD